MSSSRDFVNASDKPSFRYLICSSPRCGSTLLGEMLFETGMAGDPLEYLNNKYMASYVRQHVPSGNIPIEEYMAMIKRRRTSENGYFGMQIHFSHFMRTFQNTPHSAGAFVKSYDRVVFLRRKDRVAQAVSLYKSMITGVYSSMDLEHQTEEEKELFRSRVVPFDPRPISNTLQRIIGQDMGWMTFLQQQGISYKEMYYEDFVDDYSGQSQDILQYLGLSISDSDIPVKKLTKLGSEEDPLIVRFKEYLG